MGHPTIQNRSTVVLAPSKGLPPALLYVNQPLVMDAMIVLTNPFTQEEQQCRILFLGDATDKGQRVGLEFLTPAPHFWGVDFVPADWPAHVRPS